MMKLVPKLVCFFSLIMISSTAIWANAEDNASVSYLKDDVVINPADNTRSPLYRYSYVERLHTFEENLKNIGIVYGLSWVFYPLLQPKVFKVSNGLKQYKNNFGKIVFDKDEPVWNIFVHPLSGSQLYLLYRAQGYSRMSALGMTTISSTLFEMTVETLTEPASFQDLYQTPILGSVLGLGIETLSMSLLNSDNTAFKVLGHLMNPATLLPLYEGRTLIIPKIEPEDRGAMMQMELRY